MEQGLTETAAQDHGLSERDQIAILIEDGTNRRLIEGLAVQLSLDPVFVQEDALLKPGVLRSIALIVADEPVARRFRERGQREEAIGVLQPALVAVLGANESDSSMPARRGNDHHYDGLLVLPQLPSVVLAQLSVMLYAHRANVRRFGSALDELHLNRKIFRSVTSGVTVASAREEDFPLTYANPAFEVISGYTLEEIQGKNCRFLQKGERDQPGLTLIREALKNGHSTVAILRNFRKDGTPFWNELLLSPIFDKDGKLTHFVGIQNDVSARVAFEEALRESEKLAAAGRLAASIAHEINNPLEAIANLMYLMRSEERSPTGMGYLEQAEKELYRVSALTSQSLRFYKQSSRPQAVKPCELVSAVLDVYAVKLAHWGITVERRDRTSESIVCLESEVRQVLNNLIRNAMDAMRPQGGGRLLVRVREAEDWKQHVRGITITIADTGTGMSGETLSRLFTAFYTTKGLQGTGLGLWVTSEIVKRHHGNLRVRSRQDPSPSGTVFTLFLPYQAIAP